MNARVIFFREIEIYYSDDVYKMEQMESKVVNILYTQSKILEGGTFEQILRYVPDITFIKQTNLVMAPESIAEVIDYLPRIVNSINRINHIISWTFVEHIITGTSGFTPEAWTFELSFVIETFISTLIKLIEGTPVDTYLHVDQCDVSTVERELGLLIAALDIDKEFGTLKTPEGADITREYLCKIASENFKSRVLNKITNLNIPCLEPLPYIDVPVVRDCNVKVLGIDLPFDIDLVAVESPFFKFTEEMCKKIIENIDKLPRTPFKQTRLFSCDLFVGSLRGEMAEIRETVEEIIAALKSSEMLNLYIYGRSELTFYDDIHLLIDYIDVDRYFKDSTQPDGAPITRDYLHKLADEKIKINVLEYGQKN